MTMSALEGVSIVAHGVLKNSMHPFRAVISVVPMFDEILKISALVFPKDVTAKGCHLFLEELSNESIQNMRDELGLLESGTNFAQRIIEAVSRIGKDQVKEPDEIMLPLQLSLGSGDDSYLQLNIGLIKGNSNVSSSLILKKSVGFELASLDVKQYIVAQTILLHPGWDRSIGSTSSIKNVSKPLRKEHDIHSTNELDDQANQTALPFANKKICVAPPKKPVFPNGTKKHKPNRVIPLSRLGNAVKRK